MRIAGFFNSTLFISLVAFSTASNTLFAATPVLTAPNQAAPATQTPAAIPPASPTGILNSGSAASTLNTALVIPPAPDINAHGYVLMDAATGHILASKNMDQPMAPASLTKMMTLYIISNTLANKQITPDSLVPISRNAWQTGGSRMFVQVGTQVPVRDLLQGIIVDSGNDATMAMAEYLAGTSASFVPFMNAQAQKLGMRNTHYQDPTGLPSPNHYSTPHDIAILARALIHDFPQYYSWYKQKTFTYNKITQSNRNQLLWRDPSVDGLKTGFTDDAGYCLVASAERNGTRLISVVMGAPTNRDRYDFNEQLLNYGFSFYRSHPLYQAGTVITQARSWYGEKSAISVGVAKNLAVTLPINQQPAFKTDIVLKPNVKAPIQQGEVMGQINVTLDGQVIASAPLVALENNPKGGFFTRMVDGVHLFFHKLV